MQTVEIIVDMGIAVAHVLAFRRIGVSAAPAKAFKPGS
jgi:hypothetical protein